MKTIIRFVALIILTSGLAFISTAAAQSVYTVEDALRDERVKTVQFDPTGRYCFVERRVPVSATSRFTPSLDSGIVDIFRSRVAVIDLAQENGLEHSLFEQRKGDGYEMLPLSPDGHYLSYFHAHGNSVTVGVYDLKTRKEREFPFTPVTGSGSLKWISGAKFIMAQETPQELPFSYSGQVAQAWEIMANGAGSTASAIGSGKYARPETADAQGPVLVDASTGKVEPLAKGRFSGLSVAADGSTIAARQLDKEAPLPDGALQQSRTVALRLVVIRLNGAKGPAEKNPCPTCDVNSGSPLLWSGSGRKLAFTVFKSGFPANELALWTYDLDRDEAEPVNMGGLTQLQQSRGGSVRFSALQFAWLGDDLAVLAQSSMPGPRGTHPVRGWFLLSKSTPINLTAEFGDEPFEVVGSTRDSLLFVSGKNLWSVGAESHRRLLTRLDENAHLWRGAFSIGPGAAPRVTSSLILEASGPEGTPKTLYFVDIETGAVRTVRVPELASEVVAVSARDHRVAFAYERDHMHLLDVIDPSGQPREILRLNQHLEQVVMGTPMKIPYKGSNGEDLNAWLLIPPGYHHDRPLPTIVNIYPGHINSPDPRTLDVGDEVFLVNDQPLAQLLAGHGYAVLIPSIPQDPAAIPRDSMEGVTETVLSAVDAAIAAGYVDGDRLGIQGISFGGYGTAGVITQTHRFKAAIAGAGIYDLFSAYGTPRIEERFTSEVNGWALDRTGSFETGQFGLGGPPWRDTARYIKNSSLLAVDSISTPVMLMHGDRDSTVPFTQAEEMFTALYRLHKDAVFVRYWGEGHGVADSPANIRDFYKRVFGWYDEHIGPPLDVQRALTGSGQRQ